MSELKCHYCGAECEVIEGGIGSWVACTDLGCDTSGPTHDTPEAAAAAHATVAPVPRWFVGQPTEEGAYWIQRGPSSEPTVAMVDLYDMQRPELAYTHRFAGPIPEPPDAAEGGGL